MVSAPHLDIVAVWVHFQTAGFLAAAHGKNTDYIGVGGLTGSERMRPVDLQIAAPMRSASRNRPRARKRLPPSRCAFGISSPHRGHAIGQRAFTQQPHEARSG
jgi:hypothetical protein